MSLLRRLAADGAVVPLNLIGSVFGGAGASVATGGTDQPDFVVTREVLPYVFSLIGGRNWKSGPGDKASPLMKEIWTLLDHEGALSAQDIQAALGRELTETAVLRAVVELWNGLRAIPVYDATASETGTRWELTQARFAEELTASQKVGHATALSALVSLYLESVIAATSEEVETFLSPMTARSKVREVVNGLQATRQLGLISVGAQPLVHVAGTLPEFAEPEPTKAEVEPRAARESRPGFEKRRPGFERKPREEWKREERGGFERRPGDRKPFEGERKPVQRAAKPFREPREEERGGERRGGGFGGAKKFGKAKFRRGDSRSSEWKGREGAGGRASFSGGFKRERPGEKRPFFRERKARDEESRGSGFGPERREGGWKPKRAEGGFEKRGKSGFRKSGFGKPGFKKPGFKKHGEGGFEPKDKSEFRREGRPQFKGTDKPGFGKKAKPFGEPGRPYGKSQKSFGKPGKPGFGKTAKFRGDAGRPDQRNEPGERTGKPFGRPERDFRKFGGKPGKSFGKGGPGFGKPGSVRSGSGRSDSGRPGKPAFRKPRPGGFRPPFRKKKSEGSGDAE